MEIIVQIYQDFFRLFTLKFALRYPSSIAHYQTNQSIKLYLIVYLTKERMLHTHATFATKTKMRATLAKMHINT